MLENILTKNGRALLGIAFSFLLSNASLEAVRTYRSWNLEEDHLLRRAVETLGAVNWTAIAALFPGRTATQCRQHWNDYLNPAINRGPWTKAEDRDLVAAHRRGDGWAAIAGQLSNRTGQQCRCRFESLIALQQRAAARLPASSPAPAVVQAEVAAGGNPAAAAGAADPADPRPSRRRQLRVAVYRGPAAVAGAVGPANPPSDSASDDEGSDSSTPPSKRVPVGRNP
ncbi:MAG: hypothetical protein LBJ13_00350, partial [Puniceicoccales bacterium]|nr:hypothetical protein [Puniceicoccales bacterium]